MRTLSAAEAAAKTGRTLSAVRNRRHSIEVPDGRRQYAHQAKTLRKVPVSAATVVARINLRLKPNGRQLKRTRRGPVRRELGTYFLLDLKRNSVIEHHVDLERVAGEIGVVGPGERLVSDEE